MAKMNEEQTRFNDALRHVLSVSKTELQRREAEYQKAREGMPKRGPKPKNHASISDRVSSDKG